MTHWFQQSRLKYDNFVLHLYKTNTRFVNTSKLKSDFQIKPLVVENAKLLPCKITSIMGKIVTKKLQKIAVTPTAETSTNTTKDTKYQIKFPHQNLNHIPLLYVI
jgi:hypothetical protein